MTGAVTVAAGAAAAAPSTYYASPDSTDSSGSCPSSAPCTVSHALALAGDGDTVELAPGTYDVTSALSSSNAISVVGQLDAPRPVLAGAATLNATTLSLSGGALVRHLAVTSTSTAGDQTALSVKGGTAEDLALSVGAADTGGEALSAKATPAGTVVRTVLAVAAAPDSEAVSLKDTGIGGSVSVYNLTAVANGSGAEAISGNLPGATATVKDSIASATGDDISAKTSGRPIVVVSSAFRASASSHYTDGGGNVGAPVFVDAADGDYHEAPGSPTIDAGAADPALTSADLGGVARIQGAAVDMGAYELGTAPAPAATPEPSPTPGDSSGSSTSGHLPPAAHPVPGHSVTVGPAKGTVRVRLPHKTHFFALRRGAQLPNGAVVDATNGAIRMKAAVDQAGTVKTGTFSGGRFVIHQTHWKHPRTILRLVGGSYAGCPAIAHASSDALATASRHRRHRRRHHVVRRVKGADHGGRFTTIGDSAAATVRGTVWTTVDRCDGTLIKVARGAVAVRPRHGGRTTVVTAGHQRLVPRTAG